MKLGLAVLRALVGGLFVGHGAQKLFGVLGGHGPDGTGMFFESLGLRPGKRNAYLAGGSEMTGGALLVLGLATPVAASMVTGVMSTAIWTVHKDKGPWVSDGGWEYPAVLMAAVFALTDAGPGDWSIDAARGVERSGPGWALAQLAAGAGGSAALIALSSGETPGGADVPLQSAS